MSLITEVVCNLKTIQNLVLPQALGNVLSERSLSVCDIAGCVCVCMCVFVG